MRAGEGRKGVAELPVFAGEDPGVDEGGHANKRPVIEMRRKDRRRYRLVI